MGNLLGIEVGSKQIRYLVFSKKGRKCLVSNKGAVLLSGSAPSFMAHAVLSIISQEKIPFGDCYLTFLQDNMLSSQFILPRIPARELEEVVRGEIEKIPSFSAEDFYFTFSHRPFEDAKTKVIFSAVLKNAVDPLYSEAREKKSRFKRIELAPLNLLPLSYHLHKGKDEAMIVVDDNATYVTVNSAKECKLLYSISSGKSTLYRDDKLDSGEFLNWTEEIRRALKSYALSYNVLEVKDCWLVWDRDKPGLEQQIEGKLGLRVKSLDITLFAGFAALAGSELNPRDCIAAAPIIAELNKYNSEFNFKGMMREQFLKDSKKKLIAAFAVYSLCVVAALGSVFLFYSKERGQIKQRLVDTRASIAELEIKTQALREKRDEAIRAKELLILQAGFVRELNRVSWSRVFGEVATELPAEVAFSSFQVSGTSSVTLRGEALDVASVAELVRRIDNSRVLYKASFDFLKEAKRKDESIYFTFGILASIRKDDQ